MSVPKVYFAGKISSDYRSNIFSTKLSPLYFGKKRYRLYRRDIYYHGCFALGNCSYSDDKNPSEIEYNFFDNRHGLAGFTLDEISSDYDEMSEYFGDRKLFETYKNLESGIFTEKTLEGINTDGHKVYSHYNTNIGLSKEKVNNLCSDLIKTCDVLFAHINSSDCYGTLAEIGYAAALNKPIFLTFDKKLGYDLIADLWFITEYKSVVSSFVVVNNRFVDPTLLEINGYERCRLIDDVDPLAIACLKMDSQYFNQ